MNSQDSDNIIKKIKKNILNFSDKDAFRFYNESWELEKLSYHDFWIQVKETAKILEEKKLRGKVLILLYQPGIPFIVSFFACLLAKVIPAPCNLPRLKKRSFERFKALVDTVNADQVLVDQGAEKICMPVFKSLGITHFNTEFPSSPHFQDVYLLDKDEVVSSKDTAYLQFTSGSTSDPKGVVVSYENLNHNLALIKEFSKANSDSVIVSWLPHYHDLGLVGQILLSLVEGSTLCFMSPQTFLSRPKLWLQAISENKGTISFAPNFAYQHCVDKIKKSDLEGIDLQSWSVALNGAEPVSSKTLDVFSKKFESVGFSSSSFCPAYGLAEATLVVSATDFNSTPKTNTFSTKELENKIAKLSDNGTTLASCGPVRFGQKVCIIEPESACLLKEGQIGEVCLSGSSVSPGYWKNITATNESFVNLSEETGRFLRTGDLGFLWKSELYLCGRLKDLIVIRGENYYPQDIENVVSQSDPLFRNSGTCVFEIGSKLVVLQEVERDSVKKLKTSSFDNIRESIYQYCGLSVLDIIFLKPFEIFRTSSGKIQRHACKTAYLNKEFKSLLGRGFGKNKECDELVHWVQKELPKIYDASEADKSKQFPIHLLNALGKKGLLAMQIPKEYGGLEFSNKDILEVYTSTAEHDLSLSLLLVLNNSLGVKSILNFGSLKIKESFLYPFSQKASFLSFGLTEVGAGSNPNSISTEAVYDGQKWRINGHKIYCGSASWSDGISVFAKCFDSSKAFLGISGFFIPSHYAGVKQGKPADTMGMRGMVQNEFYLQNVYVEDHHRLVSEADGYDVAKSLMNHTRLAISAMCIGGLSQCLRYLRTYVLERKIITGPMHLNYHVQIHVSSILEAKRVLLELNHRLLERENTLGSLHPAVYAIVKILAPEILWNAVDKTVQLLGGRGYDETNRICQLFRDARVLRVFEGPTEALSHHLASLFLREGKDLFFEILYQLAPNHNKFNYPSFLDQMPSLDLCSLGETLAWVILGELVPSSWVKNKIKNFLSVSEESFSHTGETLESLLKVYEPLKIYPEVNIKVEQKNIDKSNNLFTDCEILPVLTSWLRKSLGKTVFEYSSFSSLEIDSVLAAEFSQFIEETYQINIQPTVFWELKNIRELVQFIDSKQKKSKGFIEKEQNLSIQEKIMKKLGVNVEKTFHG